VTLTHIRVWPVFLVFVIAIVIQMLAGVVALSILVTLKVAAGVNLQAAGQEAAASVGFLLIAGASADVTFFATALVAARVERRPVGPRLRWPAAQASWRHHLAAVLLMLGLSETSDRVVALLGLELGGFIQHLTLTVRDATTPVFVGICAMVVLAGLSEELFFRGYIQTRLTWRWSRPVAVGVTAALFGLAHFNRVHSTLTFFMGLALGAVTEFSGSIRPAVAAHAVNNLFASINSRYLAGTWYARKHLPVLAGSVTLFTVGLLWIRRLRGSGVEQDGQAKAS